MKDWLGKKIRLLYLLAAILSLGVGGAIAYLGNETGNPALILVGFVGLAGGFLLIKKWYGRQSTRVLSKQFAEPPNSLIISQNYIRFDRVGDEELLGLSQKCYNDGKFYHVLRDDGDGNGRPHFELPDDDENERHYDPTEMANVVTMPSNKKYFTWSATFMQKVSIGIMAIIIAGEIIGVVAMG